MVSFQCFLLMQKASFWTELALIDEQSMSPVLLLSCFVNYDYIVLYGTKPYQSAYSLTFVGIVEYEMISPSFVLTWCYVCMIKCDIYSTFLKLVSGMNFLVCVAHILVVP